MLDPVSRIGFGTELLFAHRRTRFAFVLEASLVLHAARDGRIPLAHVVDALDACFKALARPASAARAGGALEAHVSVVLHVGLAGDRV